MSVSTGSEVPATLWKRIGLPQRRCAACVWNEIVIEGEDVDPTALPIPLQFSVDAAPYIHRGPDRGPRPGHRRRHHRLPPADAEGQEPPRRLATFAPAGGRGTPAGPG